MTTLPLCEAPHCSEPATMEAPKHFCNHHWAEWWLEEMKDLMTEHQYAREYRYIMRMLEKNESQQHE